MAKVPYLSKWIKMFRTTPPDDIPEGGSDLPSTEGASVGDVLTVNGPDDVVWSAPFKPYTKVTGSFDNTGHITIQNNTYTDAGTLNLSEVHIDMDASVDFPQAVVMFICTDSILSGNIHVKVGNTELSQVYALPYEAVAPSSNHSPWGIIGDGYKGIIAILGDTYTVYGNVLFKETSDD